MLDLGRFRLIPSNELPFHLFTAAECLTEQVSEIIGLIRVLDQRPVCANPDGLVPDTKLSFRFEPEPLTNKVGERAGAIRFLLEFLRFLLRIGSFALSLKLDSLGL